MTLIRAICRALPMLCVLAFASPSLGAAKTDPQSQPPTQQSGKSIGSVEKADNDGKKVDAVSWLSNLGEANRRALADRKPLLILVGAKWCGPCRKLSLEVHTAAVQKELARWTPVYLDLDAQAGDANQLGVVGVPALRIHAAGGVQVAEREGYLTPSDLVDWLKANYDAATAAADDSLMASGPPSATAVVRLVKQFRQRNPAIREAAVRRLTPYPEQARPLVLKTFLEGSLTARLAALEVLEQWKAPLADFDPWQPETFTPARVAQLEEWGQRNVAKAAAPPKDLSAEQLADARRQIERMLTAEETEADAIRQRLAGLGAALLPEVYARLRDASSDQDRRRLLVLRYRLVASDALVLRWPGGLERLADTDSRQRRQAADELAKLAGDSEKTLLLELFADTDAVVREIGLRGLQHIGGKEANTALVRLLDDPEPNVRAAVLKQLEESPDPAMTSAVVKYLKREKDPDLIVHGICFLRATKGKESLKCLMSLLKHESWQVRAEAAVGIGKHGEREHNFGPFSQPSKSDDAVKLQVEAYVALLDLLEDKDSFVVAKAVEGLANADLAVAVEPLVKAAERNPDLAASVLTMLAGHGQMREKAIPHLRKFCKHDQARIRAAAIAALVSAAPLAADEELLAAVNDKQSEVRIAAAKAAFSLLEQARQASKNKAISSSSAVAASVIPDGGVTSTFVTVLRGFAALVSPPKTTIAPPPAPVQSSPVPATIAPSQPIAVKPPELGPVAVKPTESKPTPAKPAEGKVTEVKPTETKPVEIKPLEFQPAPKTVESKPVVSRPVVVGSATPAPIIIAAPGRPASTPKPHRDATDPDIWLKECYAGQHRPKWCVHLVSPLLKMLHAESANERVAAAMLLTPLGKASEALPVLLDTVRKNPDLAVSASDLLPWLCLDDRVKMFRDLQAIAPNADSRARLVSELSQAADRRLADVMWELLADPKLTNREAGSLQTGLLVAYLGHQYYSSNDVLPSDRRELAKAAKPRTTTGSMLQRRVALLLLTTAAAEEAAEIATKLSEDPKVGEPLQTDAFQVRLVTQSGAEAKKLAMAAIKGSHAGRKKQAIKYLVHGSSELHSFGEGLYLHGVSFSSSYTIRSGMPIVPEPPAGVTIDHIRPLMDDSDRETAATAAYLLVLLGQPEGIEPLLQYWRRDGARSDQWTKLVYRAIAVLDDPKYIPVLRDIYAKLNEYEVSEFYWTIRIMSGPEILKFRKQIREEKGQHLR